MTQAPVGLFKDSGPPPQYERFARLMEERETVERLLQKIEVLDEAERERERAAKEAARAANDHTRSDDAGEAAASSAVPSTAA